MLYIYIYIIVIINLSYLLFFSRKLYEQDRILIDIKAKIDKFNEKLQDLAEQKLKVEYDATFMELHKLKLHQELLVLKNFETFEDTLSDNVNTKLNEYLDMQDSIRDTSNKMDLCKQEILRLQEKEKKIQQQFMGAVAENKFFDFLRRIFKKRYRPPKIKTDGK